MVIERDFIHNFQFKPGAVTKIQSCGLIFIVGLINNILHSKLRDLQQAQRTRTFYANIAKQLCFSQTVRRRRAREARTKMFRRNNKHA